MKSWMKPNHEPSGKRLVRFLSAFSAELKIIIDRVAKCLFELLDVCALKCDDGSGIENLAMKQPSFTIKLYVPGISVIFQHCLTPQVQTPRRRETSELNATHRGQFRVSGAAGGTPPLRHQALLALEILVPHSDLLRGIS
jgi:hypothetical protein